MTDEQTPQIGYIYVNRSDEERQQFEKSFLERQEAIAEYRKAGLPTAQQVFAAMLKKEIAPRLRELGLKGSGQRFRLPSETHRLSLDFQRSAYNDILEVRFTVNLSAQLIDSSSTTSDGFTPPRPVWEPPKRLGVLSRGADHWWEVVPDEPTLKVADEVLQEIREFGIPWLRKQVTEGGNRVVP